MSNPENNTKGNNKTIKKLNRIVAVSYIVLIPTAVILMLLDLFVVNTQLITDPVLAILSFITILYLIVVNHSVVSSKGWSNGQKIKWTRIPFWIFLLVNMSFLAKYVASFI